MPLPRVLEPEVMDSFEEATAYDEMDHSAVNQLFVDDFLAAGGGGDILDLGTGTAQIPVALCKSCETCRVLAVDMSAEMLDIAHYNIAIADLEHRVVLDRVDAKDLPFEDEAYDAVISNSIVHHIAEPLAVLREAIRTLKPGGHIFFRDLLRPESAEEVDRLVQLYAGDETDHQRQLFDDSLRAALTVAEMQEIVAGLGFEPATVSATSDRHWTWSAVKP